MVKKDDTQIKSVHFVKGITGSDAILFDATPQVAFVGRSNVGKSSVINALVGSKVAHPSSTPGKTSEINFFKIEAVQHPILHKKYFVDLPGYGFARRSPKENEKFRKRIIWYLSETKAPKPEKVVLIIDAKVGLTDLDRDMLEILEREGHSVLILANKVDKLNQSEQIKNLKSISDGLETYNIEHMSLFPFSAKKPKNKEKVLHQLF